MACVDVAVVGRNVDIVKGGVGIEFEEGRFDVEMLLMVYLLSREVVW